MAEAWLGVGGERGALWDRGVMGQKVRQVPDSSELESELDCDNNGKPQNCLGYYLIYFPWLPGGASLRILVYK